MHQNLLNCAIRIIVIFLCIIIIFPTCAFASVNTWDQMSGDQRYIWCGTPETFREDYGLVFPDAKSLADAAYSIYLKKGDEMCNIFNEKMERYGKIGLTHESAIQYAQSQAAYLYEADFFKDIINETGVYSINTIPKNLSEAVSYVFEKNKLNDIVYFDKQTDFKPGDIFISSKPNSTKRPVSNADKESTEYISIISGLKNGTCEIIYLDEHMIPKMSEIPDNRIYNYFRGKTDCLYRFSSITAEQYIFELLTDKYQLSEAVACGILANIRQESMFVATREGDNGHAYGLCQWQNKRKANLLEYTGADYADTAAQIDFLVYELKNKYTETYERMMACPNSYDGARETANLFCYWYEAPLALDYNCWIRERIAADTYWRLFVQDSDVND